MLKLLCSIKCGYFDKYMSDSYFSFNLSFLAQSDFLNRINELIGSKRRYNIYSEEKLFEMYHDNPVQLIRDYDLGPILLNSASSSFAVKYFPEVLDKKTGPIVFPEVFKMDGYQLILTDEPDAIKDNIMEFFESLEEELKQEMLGEDSEEETDTSNEKSHFDA